jgi:hypothetical protein
MKMSNKYKQKRTTKLVENKRKLLKKRETMFYPNNEKRLTFSVKRTGKCAVIYY